MAKIEHVAFPVQVPKRIQVAAYARVSTGKDAMLHSLSAQVSAYSGMVQNHKGWQYAGVYADTAKTGTAEIPPEGSGIRPRQHRQRGTVYQLRGTDRLLRKVHPGKSRMGLRFRVHG